MKEIVVDTRVEASLLNELNRVCCEIVEQVTVIKRLAKELEFDVGKRVERGVLSYQPVGDNGLGSEVSRLNALLAKQSVLTLVASDGCKWETVREAGSGYSANVTLAKND